MYKHLLEIDYKNSDGNTFASLIQALSYRYFSCARITSFKLESDYKNLDGVLDIEQLCLQLQKVSYKHDISTPTSVQIKISPGQKLTSTDLTKENIRPICDEVLIIDYKGEHDLLLTINIEVKDHDLNRDEYLSKDKNDFILLDAHFSELMLVETKVTQVFYSDIKYKILCTLYLENKANKTKIDDNLLNGLQDVCRDLLSDVKCTLKSNKKDLS